MINEIRHRFHGQQGNLKIISDTCDRSGLHVLGHHALLFKKTSFPFGRIQ